MAIKTMWCPVLQTHVTSVTDLDQRVIRVICYEFEEATRTCRVKRRALQGGPLAQLLMRASDNALADPLVSCGID